jgi:putative hemolysin
MINKDVIYNSVLFLILGVILGILICIIFSPDFGLLVNTENSNTETDYNDINNNPNNSNNHNNLNSDPVDIIGIPNPASLYCEEQGGKLIIKTKEDGSQYGVCVLSNFREIDEWELYNLDHKICPQVCIEMWKITNNSCEFIDCGSGCGPNNITTFETKEECFNNISSN